MKITLDKFIEKLEENDFNYNYDKEENKIEIGVNSPEGQDFWFTIDCDDILGNLYDYIEDFDADAETYIWLDSDGHGTNGAPYHMRDVLDDMEAVHDMIKEFYDNL